MYRNIVRREKYNPKVDLTEGDLVSVEWADDEIGIVLKVMLDLRNDDHLCPTEEILIAEVYLSGTTYIFEEEELEIIAKCNI